MTHGLGRYARNQNGFTLIEVVIASAIGAILMAGLTSVMLTSWRASTTATNRIEASGQIRNFEFFAYDDFARSRVPYAGGCSAAPCTTQPIVLNGWQVNISAPLSAPPYQVTYAWDGVQFIDRQVQGISGSLHAATGVTAFSWFVDDSTPQHPTVVINMTITVGSYQESQTLRFLPQVMG